MNAGYRDKEPIEGESESGGTMALLSALDAESFFELGGKLLHRFTDLGGLFGERGGHAFGGFGFAAN